MNKKVLDALKNIGVPVSYIKREKAPVSVSFFMLTGVPEYYSDDDYEYLGHEIQVDIWADYGQSITQLKKNIISAMKNEAFSLSSIGPDIYENDTNILHKPLEFKYLEKQIKESE